MKIWLATAGEPLPTDSGHPRLLRTGQLAAWLAARGHNVTFWTNAFDHFGKRMRFTTTTSVELGENYRIVALAGRAYQRNISIARILNHRDVARSFLDEAGNHPAPDVILSSYPLEELCRSILDYAEPRGIPVIVDTRDFWPDIFSELLPAPTRFLAPVLLAPLEQKARKTLSRATGLSGMTESALRWALKKSGRDARPADFWFPFSYARTATEHTAAASQGFPVAFGALEGIKVCFLGSLSHRSNLELVIDAFRLLAQRGVKAELAICGRGEAESDLKKRAGGLPNVHFSGWLDADKLREVMAVSDFGVLPYDRSDFHMSLPNKFVEYLAGGLAILSCTPGEVQNFIRQEECGAWVEASPEALADAIAAAQLHPDVLDKAKQSAREAFAETFDQEVVFSKVLDHLSTLANQTRP